ncbi:MAG: hypothetical protein COU70_02080 [Parcubacteria group bacterium CG10_big_fil_rev_8_21_14_0_10_35_15]|nr:MAG: hypothetical protein COU70_02080 [Parcubacteria group bacterium CG10_big_fil_rev_8_21_14_0_10_35_15]
MKFKILKIVDKKKIKKFFVFFKNLPWIIGDNIFSFFVVMIFIAIIVGSFFFVRNIVQIEDRISINPSRLPVFNNKAIEVILNNWRLRQDKFDGINEKIYPNLFLPKSK